MSESFTLHAGDLSVVLLRSGDRYRHEILSTAGERQLLLASVEGTDDQAWPPSPPFQEVHLRQDGVYAALLVGRAGRGHWSASIEPDPSQQAILFDVACRSSGDIDWLGSSYRWFGEAVAPSDDAQAFFLSPDLQLHVLEGEARLGEEGKTGALSIVPRWTASRGSQTVRWRYRVRRAGRPASSA
ncbi:MAG TPA: hypothetical protein VG826_09600 [Pirellulales bacterium]|nr:hypothetical protein [Pirellulales bacterium]